MGHQPVVVAPPSGHTDKIGAVALLMKIASACIKRGAYAQRKSGTPIFFGGK